ncbi:MoaD/ThiS family protein [Sphingomonas sp. TX0543]|uniref:MoaD/ThiS family protein n=1 Tax=Sphingomonas sp. TX0543 TaxID=3399682 RepID=UPI003AFA0D86
MGMVKVRFFGRFAEEIARSVEMPIECGMTVAGLREALASRFGADQLLGARVLAAVDDRIVHDDLVLLSGQAVDLLAPLSGG